MSRWERLVRRVGRRGCMLIFFALIDFDIAWSLRFLAGDFTPPPFTHGAHQLLSPNLWALLWAIVGVLCLEQAFRASDRIGYAAAALIKMLWGLLYISTAVLNGPRTALVPGLFWLALAGWVLILATWPEPPPRTRPGKRDG